MGVNSLPKTVTRQRRDCDLNPDPSVPAWVQHANHSATEPPTTIVVRVMLATGRIAADATAARYRLHPAGAKIERVHCPRGVSRARAR